jgi:hypothetical protein
LSTCNQGHRSDGFASANQVFSGRSLSSLSLRSALGLFPLGLCTPPPLQCEAAPAPARSNPHAAILDRAALKMVALSAPRATVSTDWKAFGGGTWTIRHLVPKQLWCATRVRTRCSNMGTRVTVSMPANLPRGNFSPKSKRKYTDDEIKQLILAGKTRREILKPAFANFSNLSVGFVAGY